jgi:hypothetical protein
MIQTCQEYDVYVVFEKILPGMEEYFSQINCTFGKTNGEYAGLFTETESSWLNAVDSVLFKLKTRGITNIIRIEKYPNYK